VSIHYLLGFTVVWVAGVALADFVLEIEANAWSMLWGYVVFSLAQIVGNAVIPSHKERR
jgi:hypothetical protein